MENINYLLTAETAKDICKAFGEDIESLEPWQVCELVDKLIDKALCEMM